MAIVRDILQFARGCRLKITTGNVHDTTPTEAQIIAEHGAAAAVGAGYIGLIDDAGGNTNEYLVWSNGTKWMFLKGTVAA